MVLKNKNLKSTMFWIGQSKRGLREMLLLENLKKNHKRKDLAYNFFLRFSFTTSNHSFLKILKIIESRRISLLMVGM
jgi:hypothetical protein